MNRQEAITQLAQLCVLTNDKTIGVILPSFEEAKLFQKELLVKIDEVPGWLLKLRYRNVKHLETESGTRMWFLHSGRSSRGMTFNAFYISSRLTNEQKSEYVFSYLTMPHQTLITFEDN